jgi:hypothetical protein
MRGGDLFPDMLPGGDARKTDGVVGINTAGDAVCTLDSGSTNSAIE